VSNSPKPPQPLIMVLIQPKTLQKRGLTLILKFQKYLQKTKKIHRMNINKNKTVGVYYEKS
jgi:hypothetical protein